MGNVAIEYIKPGMILECDVKDRNGRLLLQSGTEIRAKHINIFRTWGVPEVDIRGVTGEDVLSEASERFAPELLKRVEAEMEELFLHTDRANAAMKELVRLCTLYRVRKLAAGARYGQ